MDYVQRVAADAATHDFYLTKSQILDVRLPHHYILFDEDQDASGVMLDVFLKQPATKALVGDAHQSVYGWCFAINSLEQTDFAIRQLSTSFRFGPAIAALASRVLSWKMELGEPQPVQVLGASVAPESSQTKAINSYFKSGRRNTSACLQQASCCWRWPTFPASC